MIAVSPESLEGTDLFELVFEKRATSPGGARSIVLPQSRGLEPVMNLSRRSAVFSDDRASPTESNGRSQHASRSENAG
jgi:hypothetical protein